MFPSALKMPLQILPGSMDLLGHVRRRYASHPADLRRLQASQVEEEHISIERLESLNELHALSKYDHVIRRTLDVGFICQVVGLFQTCKTHSPASSLLAYVGRCCVVRHAIDPGSQGALIPECRHTAP